MKEQEGWVPKAEAAREMGVSLSTLDRRIKKGEVEVFREGRRVFVRIHGPKQISDADLLRQSMAREVELQRTVEMLERTATNFKHRASQLERERDEAKEAVSAGRLEYHELESAHQKESAKHSVTKDALNVFRVIAFVLLAVLVGAVLLWWFVLR